MTQGTRAAAFVAVAAENQHARAAQGVVEKAAALAHAIDMSDSNQAASARALALVAVETAVQDASSLNNALAMLPAQLIARCINNDTQFDVPARSRQELACRKHLQAHPTDWLSFRLLCRAIGCFRASTTYTALECCVKLVRAHLFVLP